ncbi:hypothetical protein LA2_10959 (plasmid) [Lactobacillus amylovorus GRL 1112]|uniref:Uncharacterized protein n=1 Tax=Lactobacillus amylovorus (strain GRL 1112) TaxID=695560 RepID=F2M3S1_LACAR|nr:hypothetical protein LA2_10959 [Lactobacillus amylovorus GRL 1112]
MTMAVNRQMPDETPIYHKTVYRFNVCYWHQISKAEIPEA